MKESKCVWCGQPAYVNGLREYALCERCQTDDRRIRTVCFKITKAIDMKGRPLDIKTKFDYEYYVKKYRKQASKDVDLFARFSVTQIGKYPLLK